MASDLLDRLWYGADDDAAALRGVLRPLSRLYGSIVASRTARFDGQPSVGAALPAISIGNLTVGGTGKTPVASWVAGTLAGAGASPAIVLRGYGDDEPQVHATLTPTVPVVVDADRVRGMQTAAARGARVAVLDDAFQHRRAPRVEDLVLISADRWTGRIDLLPAGPFREPVSALRRATLVVVTVKASDAAVPAVRRAVEAAAPAVPVAVVGLTPDELVAVGGGNARAPLSSLQAARVLLVSGIGDPSALAAQVRAAGVAVTPLVFPDHEPYGEASRARIMAAAAGHDAVVCTLKDAVKLGGHWPQGGTPLWYLAQRVRVLDGASALDAALARLIAAAGGRVPS